MANSLVSSHLKLLNYNNINVSKIDQSNVGEILDKLVNKKGKPISDNYKISILKTLKQYNNILVSKPSQLGLHTVRKSQSFNNKQKILKTTKYCYTISPATISLLPTTAAMDTIIAIILATSTTITITDIYKITISDLKELNEKNTLSLTKIMHVIPNLFDLAKPIINNLIQTRNSKFTIERYTSKPKFTTHAITCSSNVINKQIKDLYQYVNGEGIPENSQSIGLKSFKISYVDLLFQYITNNDL